MKQSIGYLTGSIFLLWAWVGTAGATPSGPAREVLAREALNAITWATAGLHETIPSDIRRNMTYLREDLLDEGKQAAATSAASYKLGTQLCDALIAALDEHERMAVRVGYRAALANNNTKVEDPDLRVQRNYLMSWTQYAHEQSLRTELERRQTNQASLANQSVLVEWSNQCDGLRFKLDASYRRYREALRQDPGYKPGQTATSALPPTPDKKPAPVAATSMEMPATVKELFTSEFRALPEDEQFKRVAAKLKELNPEFDGNLPKPNKWGVAHYAGIPLVNLWPLRALISISELRCHRTLYDLSPLAGMSSLQVLKIAHSRVTDLSPLTGLRLTVLDVCDTRVADLTPLAGMPLEELGCHRTKVKDLSSLKTMKNLRNLICDFVPARDAEILRSIKTLETINRLPVAEFWKQMDSGKVP